ncbi:MAG: Stk1 family PASTA domain-containing Ser/Thr kinase [Gemmiger sp.]|nr:Stk1 family PASTA domain-containing Ser/Thr kinase [Gemmiger sp.]
MDNIIGSKLDGRYLVESLIGVGGMANVYRGTDSKTGDAVAVKVLKEEFLDNEELVRRFKNESKAISILDHPNIVKVYDVSVTDTMQYIVMEYIDGITLKEYLKQRGGPLTWKEVVHFATQILSALDHAHSKGIVHRDVKPQNIMLLANGSIKMMDFGIARFSRAQSQTVSDKAIGSVHYISPEQAKGDKTDARTDLYAVGVMLYEMLSGRLPFDGSGAVSIAIKQISDAPTPLAQIAPDVPQGLRQITERAMAKDPEERYPSAAAMLEAVNEFRRDPAIHFAYEYAADATGKPAGKPQTGAAATASIKTAAARTGTGTAARKPRPKRKNNSRPFSVLPIFAGMAVAFVIGAFILVYLIFANSTNPLFSNRADVQLISFVNMTEDEFRASEYYTKLSAVWVHEYNADYDEGTIYQQNPKAGRTVKEGQKITLKVSKGTQWVTVPNTTSMVQEDAVTTLKTDGLTVVVNPIQDDSVAEGTVVRTEPAAGEQIAGGTTVTVYVAQAKMDTGRTVPSVTGMDKTDAVSSLRSINLIPSLVEQASDQPAGTIISQSPTAGSLVKMNATVKLYVSTGISQAILDQQAQAALEQQQQQAAVDGWYDQDENGNWYHVNPDGTRDG